MSACKQYNVPEGMPILRKIETLACRFTILFENHRICLGVTHPWTPVFSSNYDHTLVRAAQLLNTPASKDLQVEQILLQ